LAEELFARELGNRSGAAVIRMHRDRNAEAPRGIEVLPIGGGIDRARRAGGHTAPREAEAQEAFAGILVPLAVAALEILEIDRLRAGLALRRAVGEAPAQAGLAQRAQVGVRVIRAADVVAPVVHEGDAGVDRLRAAETRTLVHVIGGVGLAEIERGREV